MLPALVKQLDDSPEARERAAFVAWDAVAGEGVSRVTVAQQLVGRRLVIAAADTTWKRQLDRLAPQYIFSINSLLGSPMITQIAFRIDPSAVAIAHPPDAPAVTKSAIDAAVSQITDCADVIEDPKLKETFLRAAGTCLARNPHEGARKK